MLDPRSRPAQAFLDALFFQTPYWGNPDLYSKVSEGNSWYGEEETYRYEKVSFEPDFFSIRNLKNLMETGEAQNLLDGFTMAFAKLLGTHSEHARTVIEDQRERRSRYNLSIRTIDNDKLHILQQAVLNNPMFEPIQSFMKEGYNHRLDFYKTGGLNQKERELVRLLLKENKSLNIYMEHVSSRPIISLKEVWVQEGDPVKGTINLGDVKIEKDMRGILAYLEEDDYFELLADESTTVKPAILLKMSERIENQDIKNLYEFNNAQAKLLNQERSNFTLRVDQSALVDWLNITQPDVMINLKPVLDDLKETPIEPIVKL